MNVTITIEAPELIKAMNILATAMLGQAEAKGAPPVKKTPVAPPPEEKAPEQPVAQSPASTKQVTLEQVRARLAELSSDGKKAQIKELMAKFGFSKLTEVPQEKFGELLAEAEAI